MALIQPTPLFGSDGINSQTVQWVGANSNSQFQPVNRGDLVDHSFQVTGTFGAGTNVQIVGSNDATNITNGTYFPLTDPFGTIINMTAAGLRQTTEMTVWVKPNISAGDGTENLTITLSVRRSYR